MPTTWYFDGSGTDTNSRIMALSGVGASDAAWGSFNREWIAALTELGINAWHSTDYFRRRRGQAKEAVPTSLLNILGKQLSHEFNAVSYAVGKAAGNALRHAHPKCPRLKVSWRIYASGRLASQKRTWAAMGDCDFSLTVTSPSSIT